MIVVDTNVIAYLFLAGDRSPQAERVFIRDPEWAAPFLWRGELRSVLAPYIRTGRLTLNDAVRIMDDASDILTGQEREVTSSRVLALVHQSTCSAYDCEFVAVAAELGVPLITADKQILDQFPSITLSMDAFADL